MEDTELIKFGLQIPKDLHKWLKTFAAQNDTTMQDVLYRASQIGLDQALAEFGSANTTELRKFVAVTNLAGDTKGNSGTVDDSENNQGRQFSRLGQVLAQHPALVDIFISSLRSALEILASTRKKGGPDDRVLISTLELLAGLKKGA